MNNQKAHSYLIICLGVALILVSFIASYFNKVDYFTDCLMIIFTFCIGIVAKLIVNRYMALEQYHLLNTLVLVSLFKMMLIMMNVTNFRVNGFGNLVNYNYIMKNIILETVAFILAYYFAKKKIGISIGTYLEIGIYLFIMIGCNYLKETVVMQIVPYVIVIGIAIIVGINKKNKLFAEKVLGESSIYLKISCYTVILQYLFQLVCLENSIQHGIVMITCQFFKLFCLCYGIFFICVYLPWYQRVDDLTEAEEKIYLHLQSCDMIVNLSHELKTPVNVIRSALDLLVLDVTGSMKIEVKQVKDECNRVMNIIQDMIDIQKINTSHIVADIQNYNLVELFENVIDAFAEQIPECHLIFNPQEEEINQRLDGNLMQQAFMLLIGIIIQYDLKKETYIEIEADKITEKIYMKIMSSSINELKALDKLLKQFNGEEIEEVGQLLTLKLIYTILELQNISWYFEKNEQDEMLYIIFNMDQEGKRTWLDERSIAVLNDQIRCRYVEV